jgi:hypothetical protein
LKLNIQSIPSSLYTLLGITDRNRHQPVLSDLVVPVAVLGDGPEPERAPDFFRWALQVGGGAGTESCIQLWNPGQGVLTVRRVTIYTDAGVASRYVVRDATAALLTLVGAGIGRVLGVPGSPTGPGVGQVRMDAPAAAAGTAIGYEEYLPALPYQHIREIPALRGMQIPAGHGLTIEQATSNINLYGVFEWDE